MCGIFLEILNGSSVNPSNQFFESRAAISRRGPDHVDHVSLELDECTLHCLSSVLHMRGSKMTLQPLRNSRYILQWNGEVFGGLEVIRNTMFDFLIYFRFQTVPAIPR